MQTSRVVAATAVVTVVVTLLLCVTWVYSGLYDPAATAGDGGVVAAAADVMTDRSIAVRARALPPPPVLDSGALRAGAERYQALCTGCHGAPGFPRDIAGEGLIPAAPDLARTDMSEAEVFWVTRNGIRRRGMPSYRLSHTDEQLWAIAKFAKRTAGMTEEQYEAFFLELMKATGSPPPPAHAH